MKDFERDFGISKIVKLEQNYRSHGNILEAANTLIEKQYPTAWQKFVDS